ncbi:MULTISPECIES: ABC transporter ATP-binding protein [Paenibacillus]|uniref:ABC transporter ATP-binding protein n=1 Tax=Paenibacillus TaxID=44249 RepID=UPI001B1183FB|nr:ABC transporter ATP-binding protein [Paenibacillus lactis]GIO89445.1 lipid A ABC transporter permease/ATP-binding protein [Paenibacillus lactis]
MAQAINNWQMDQKADPNAPVPKTKPVSTIRALSGYMKEHRLTFAAFIGCTLIAISAELLQPYLMKIAIDDNLLVGKNDVRGLMIICAIYFLLSLISMVFTYLQNNLLQKAGQSIVASIRKRLFAHISKLSMSYFDKVPSGSLITHVSSDTESVSQFFNQVLLSVFRDGFTLIFILVMMFQLDVTLTLYCLILLPIIAGIAIAFRRYMRHTYQMARTRLSRLVAFTAENLSGMNLVQAFHQEEEQERQFKERNDSYFKANLREIRTNVLFNRTYEILNNLAIAVVTWLGGRAVLGLTLEFGVLYAFITYIRMFFQPINTITQQWNTLQSASVAINRIWGLLAVQPEVTDPKTPVRMDQAKVQGRIDFNRITFGYGDGAPVIRDLDLHVKPGEMIGIVGTTGAGKSSLISLLCRFYDVQEGSVKIDGIDIREMAQSDLHRIVGLVQQEPYLYSGTVLDNVRLFDDSISKERVIEACRFIGADPIIQGMSKGYDTRLSERGSGLSAGERQLISFARIIVFQPKILILDEATANLDSHTEQLIQNALLLVAQGRTTLVIAHRLSTIMGADRILVMSKGQIAEQGTHQELLDSHGYYEELYLHSQGQKQKRERAGAGLYRSQ